MFTLKDEDTFDWPVDVRGFVRDDEHPEGGALETFRFIAIFRALARDELDAAATGAADWFARILVGWHAVLDDDTGEPVPFSAEARDRLLAQPGVARAVTDAYARAMLGEEYAQKN